MCLTKLIGFRPNNTGYKIFIRSQYEQKNKENQYYITPLLNFRCEFNKWSEATPQKMFTEDDTAEYSSGFHIYNNLEDAKNSYFMDTGGLQRLAICEVEYEDFITGYGDGSNEGKNVEQIVAQRMKIIKEVK